MKVHFSMYKDLPFSTAHFSDCIFVVVNPMESVTKGFLIKDYTFMLDGRLFKDLSSENHQLILLNCYAAKPLIAESWEECFRSF